ncbi:hypothetical protein NX794_32940 [Streptomyces sp. LP11]|uniref:Lipoprotein n=1 Tax=Streptomyces pyxinicus TaxID=2970331 RepID=A0ABT2BBS9_9ACTN|nr:hypothetical protein [Streptomyces sp. LP11]MCS0605978.1 hypothetical protein [Streptomyces sp. LP11]
MLVHRFTAPGALAVVAAALLAGGCGGGSSKDTAAAPSSGVDASKVCGGALDSAASKALRRLADADRFDGSGGANEAGGSGTFSVQNVVGHLHDEYSKREACWVYKSGDDSGDPLLEIRFSASRTYPTASAEESAVEGVSFPVGVYARVGTSGADLFFRCSTKAPSAGAYVGDTKYVKAELFSPAGKIRGDSAARDRITVLNSVSRLVAQKAGCASEADLPMSPSWPDSA